MSRIADDPVTRSPFTATASAPASQSSSTTVRTSAAVTRRSDGSPPGGTWSTESSSWMTSPVPWRAMSPAEIRALARSSLTARTAASLPGPRSSTAWICVRRSSRFCLSWSCWAWSPSAVWTSGARSWLVYVVRGTCEFSWAAMRKPRARRARPSVTCQLATPYQRKGAPRVLLTQAVRYRAFRGYGRRRRSPRRPRAPAQPGPRRRWSFRAA